MMRCAAQEMTEDDVICGCEAESVTMREATGTLAQEGQPLMVALCQDHAALADGGTATFTITLKRGPR